MAAAGSVSGGVVMGLQPVYDGTWSSRGYNVLVGSVTGALFTPLAGPVLSATGAAVAPLVRATGLKVGETSRSVGNAIVKLYDAKKGNRGRVVEYGGGSAVKNSEKSLLNQFNRSIDPRIQTPAPVEVYHGYADLTSRQCNLLTELSKPGKSVTIYKSDINVTDLAALTAKTGDEFAMFTLGSRRMVFRGNKYETKLRMDVYDKLKNEKWTWSAHTHPGTANTTLLSSAGDRNMLVFIEQDQSLILNSSGRRSVFNTDGHSIDIAGSVNKPGGPT